VPLGSNNRKTAGCPSSTFPVPFSSLQKRIDSREARIAILGLGTVGLPLARVFCDAGFRVLGFDTDPERVAQLARGINPLTYLNHGVLETMLAGDRFSVTRDAERLSRADVLILCVPTPLDDDSQPDLSHVEAAAETVARALRGEQLVVLESTTWPGTCRRRVLPRLEASGLQLGRDFFLAYSPEREDPGREDFTTSDTPRLVGGLDEASTELARSLYSTVIDEVLAVSSCEVAEAAKLFENTFRAVNIALVNELKLVLDKLGVDVWEVCEAAASKPFGFMPFTPGPGMGGHCIPVDPYYLAWSAREVGVDTRFVEAAGEVNRRMAEFVVERTLAALAEEGIAAAGARVLVLGLAYKRDVDSLCEAPAIRILELLHEAGVLPAYSDPWVAEGPAACAAYLDQPNSLELTLETVASFDLVLLVTDHSAFDYAHIARHARLVVDTRNAFAKLLTGDPRYSKA